MNCNNPHNNGGTCDRCKVVSTATTATNNELFSIDNDNNENDNGDNNDKDNNNNHDEGIVNVNVRRKLMRLLNRMMCYQFN